MDDGKPLPNFLHLSDTTNWGYLWVIDDMVGKRTSKFNRRLILVLHGNVKAPQKHWLKSTNAEQRHDTIHPTSHPKSFTRLLDSAWIAFTFSSTNLASRSRLVHTKNSRVHSLSNIIVTNLAEKITQQRSRASVNEWKLAANDQITIKPFTRRKSCETLLMRQKEATLGRGCTIANFCKKRYDSSLQKVLECNVGEGEIERVNVRKIHGNAGEIGKQGKIRRHSWKIKNRHLSCNKKYTLLKLPSRSFAGVHKHSQKFSVASRCNLCKSCFSNWSNKCHYIPISISAYPTFHLERKWYQPHKAELLQFLSTEDEHLASISETRLAVINTLNSEVLSYTRVSLMLVSNK